MRKIKNRKLKNRLEDMALISTFVSTIGTTVSIMSEEIVPTFILGSALLASGSVYGFLRVSREIKDIKEEKELINTSNNNDFEDIEDTIDNKSIDEIIESKEKEIDDKSETIDRLLEETKKSIEELEEFYRMRSDEPYDNRKTYEKQDNVLIVDFARSHKKRELTLKNRSN